MRVRRSAALCLTTLAAALGSAVAGGCAPLGFAAYAIDRATPRKVDAQYRGLEGKSFAVVAMADRSVEAEFPLLVAKVVTDVTKRLVDEQDAVDAAGYVPAERVLGHLYSRPNWVARPLPELAAALQVERLIFIEITDFRIHDPGNRYLWNGVSAGIVQVYEADGPFPDDPAFDTRVIVTFPDDTGVGEGDIAGNVVATELVRRFVDRSAWLFYDHKESKDLKY